jgi:hypothetical protein
MVLLPCTINQIRPMALLIAQTPAHGLAVVLVSRRCLHCLDNHNNTVGHVVFDAKKNRNIDITCLPSSPPSWVVVVTSWLSSAYHRVFTLCSSLVSLCHLPCRYHNCNYGRYAMLVIIFTMVAILPSSVWSSRYGCHSLRNYGRAFMLPIVFVMVVVLA